MTETATKLKSYLSSNFTNQTVTLYSQSLWNDLFDFVQYVTCSNNTAESKVEWIEYSERLFNAIYNSTNNTEALDYHDLMLTLTQKAKEDPTCHPQSYVEYFGMSTPGTVDINMLVLRQEELRSKKIKDLKTLGISFMAGAFLACLVAAFNIYRKKR